MNKQAGPREKSSLAIAALRAARYHRRDVVRKAAALLPELRPYISDGNVSDPEPTFGLVREWIEEATLQDLHALEQSDIPLEQRRPKREAIKSKQFPWRLQRYV